MNQIVEGILTRRSIRSFIDKRISKEDLDTIVTAALHSPSGMNRQSWKFVVIQDKMKIEKLAKAVAAQLGKTYQEYNFYQPDTMILVSNQKDNTNGLADTGVAMQNIMLAAHSLGIGSVWVNQLKTICDEETIRPILSELGLPEDHIVWGSAALGYAANQPREKALAEDSVIYHL